MPTVSSNRNPPTGTATVTANGVAAGTKSRRPVVRSQRNWRKFCSRHFRLRADPAAASFPVEAARNDFHTCEPQSQLATCYPQYLQLFMNGPRRAMARGMKLAGIGFLLLGGLLFAGTQDSEFNVNTRYTVET